MAKVASFLQVHTLGLGSDCLLAVKHLQKGQMEAPWKLRPWISEFQQLGLAASFQVNKITRIENQGAHLLAVQAKSVLPHNPCTMIRTSPNHVHGCAVLSALKAVSWGSMNLKHVLCC